MSFLISLLHITLVLSLLAPAVAVHAYVSDYFALIVSRGLAFTLDAGQSPSASLERCAGLARQARKTGAVYRDDTKTCYFKNLVQNGTKMYAPRYSTSPFASYDVPGYDVRSGGSYAEANRFGGCDVIVENGGRFWCKQFDRCDKCTLMMTFSKCL